MPIVTLNEYQDAAHRTGGKFASQDEAIKCWMMGLAGETGELVDTLKKHFYHGKSADPEHVLKELGDILWYLAMASRDLGFTLQDVANANIKKLQKRYPDGFNHEASRERADLK